MPRKRARNFSGIIPAYAGSTKHAMMALAVASDHPRIRGEHKNIIIACVCWSGSSPHTRGAPTATNASSPTVRIIPAYAGSTAHLLSGAPRRADHPRIRGEHRTVPKHCQMAEGSSPHTRGARRRRVGELGLGRIIPAYAGSTPCRLRRTVPKQDHPRIRGEHSRGAAGRLGSAGSSPHTRGAPPPVWVVLSRKGIIPAYAGSTSPTTDVTTMNRDHPRIRGEHGGCQAILVDSDGSSPHTRGAPVDLV